jgi:NADPH:quinone reductase-like Zn-dependent oxidoreductase
MAVKAAFVQAVLAGVGPAIESGDVRPVIDRVLPLDRVADAHRALEESNHVGKILLTT